MQAEEGCKASFYTVVSVQPNGPACDYSEWGRCLRGPVSAVGSRAGPQGSLPTLLLLEMLP